MALAEAQFAAGLVSGKELADLKRQEANFDIDRIMAIEKETRHDVVAAIKEFAEKAPIGGGKIHLGATSMDVVDNADCVRMRESLIIIETDVHDLLGLFVKKINDFAYLPCMGYTHLQPAEPTTVGYRLAGYAQDLWLDNLLLQAIKPLLKGKGLKGAVGTAASYVRLLGSKKFPYAKLEYIFLKKLGLDAYTVSTQVYPRKVDYFVMSLLASIASSVGKFAEDLRILQSPMYGEWAEPFGKGQVGSSAMPFKKNPVTAEKICSLARYIIQLPQVAAQNALLSHLERTLDDSANKRVIVAEAFIALSEILKSTRDIVSGLILNESRIETNLRQYAPFALTEVLLGEAVMNGADRQKMHEKLRQLSLITWEAIQKGKPNNLLKLVRKDKEISRYINNAVFKNSHDIRAHVGDAPQRALKLASQIKRAISTQRSRT